MDKTSLLLIYTDIHKTDVAYLQQLVKMLDARIYHQQLQKEKFSGLPTSSDLEKDHIASTIAFLHAVSALVSKISYKKGSIKERHRSMPWSSLEFLQHILVAYEDVFIKFPPSTKKSPYYGLELCSLVLPYIENYDIPELHFRLSEILAIELEKVGSFDRSVMSYPPAVGLSAITRLTGFFVDQLQLQTMITCIDQYRTHSKRSSFWEVAPSQTADLTQKVALLRVLAMLGETSKFLTKPTKNLDTTLPWKNLEKVRDLLSHVSRIPMKMAVQSLLENKVISVPEESEKTTEKPSTPVPTTTADTSTTTTTSPVNADLPATSTAPTSTPVSTTDISTSSIHTTTTSNTTSNTTSSTTTSTTSSTTSSSPITPSTTTSSVDITTTSSPTSSTTAPTTPSPLIPNNNNNGNNNNVKSRKRPTTVEWAIYDRNWIVGSVITGIISILLLVGLSPHWSWKHVPGSLLIVVLTGISVWLGVDQQKKSFKQELVTSLRGIPLPPDLLENVLSKDLLELKNRLQNIAQNHQNQLYRSQPTRAYFQAVLFVGGLHIFFENMISIEYSFFGYLIWNFIFVSAEIGLLVLMFIHSEKVFVKKQKTINELWSDLDPGHKLWTESDRISKKKVEEATQQKSTSITSEDLKTVLPVVKANTDENSISILPLLEQAIDQDSPLSLQQTLSVPLKKQLFKIATQPREGTAMGTSKKESWGILLFGTQSTSKRDAKLKPTETSGPSSAVTSPKQERLKKYIQIHENSTLNIERNSGLDNIKTLRQFLQNPAPCKSNIKKMSVVYALQAIQNIEELFPVKDSKEDLCSDYVLRFAIEYYVCVVVLYMFQIKHYYPKQLGTKHISMRDHYMHGKHHSYAFHLDIELLYKQPSGTTQEKGQGSKMLVNHTKFILEEVKPVLLNIQNNPHLEKETLGEEIEEWEDEDDVDEEVML